MSGSEELRPVAISGHQEYWTGYFHRFVEHNGEAKAIIENQRGEIRLVDAYTVKFLNKQEVSEDTGLAERFWAGRAKGGNHGT